MRALVELNRLDQLRSHLQRARATGLTKEEMAEAITELAFYAGWSNPVTAVTIAREVFQSGRRSRPISISTAPAAGLGCSRSSPSNKKGLPPTMMMMGFDGTIPDRDLWSIVNYIRTLAPKR